MSERHKKRRLSEGPFSTLEASQLQKRRLFTDTWTELENREERIAVPARHWMLCYKLFLINEGCFPRGDSCAQLERLDGLLHCSAFIPSHQWGRKPACADHGEKKGLKELFFSFVNHWEHFFFSKTFKTLSFFIVSSEGWTHSFQFSDLTAVFYRLATELLSFVK